MAEKKENKTPNKGGPPPKPVLRAMKAPTFEVNSFDENKPTIVITCQSNIDSTGCTMYWLRKLPIQIYTNYHQAWQQCQAYWLNLTNDFPKRDLQRFISWTIQNGEKIKENEGLQLTEPHNLIALPPDEEIDTLLATEQNKNLLLHAGIELPEDEQPAPECEGSSPLPTQPLTPAPETSEEEEDGTVLVQTPNKYRKLNRTRKLY